MAKDYTCCGLRLADLHALVEHFEEKHVLLLEEPTPGLPNATNAGPTTSQTAIHHGSSTVAPQNLLQGQQTLQQPNQAAELDVESMDLDDSTQSEPPSSTSTTGPSTPLTPVLPFDTTSLKVPSAGSTLSGPNGAGLRLELAFNRYAHYNEFSSLLPGTLKSPLSSPSVSSPNCASPDWARHVRQKSQTKDCTTPSLLSSPVASILLPPHRRHLVLLSKRPPKRSWMKPYEHLVPRSSRPLPLTHSRNRSPALDPIARSPTNNRMG